MQQLRYVTRLLTAAVWTALALMMLSCEKDDDKPAAGPFIEADVFSVAGGCYSLATDGGHHLRVSDDGASYEFAVGDDSDAAAFRLRAADLGQYVLYDTEANYLAAVTTSVDEQGVETMGLVRTNDQYTIHTPYQQLYSVAEWELQPSGKAEDLYLLRHMVSDNYLSVRGLAPQSRAAAVRLAPAEGCLEYPEMTLDAAGEVRSEPWPDGDVFGAADIHSHIFTNEGFGGGGIFHGAPFHRLGVEHALPDCTENHGENGEADILGYVYDGGHGLEAEILINVLNTGTVNDVNHATTGWPVFEEWPNARRRQTHQTQYYRWLERAYMGGLRLIVQHATGNSALCELLIGVGSQEAPYTCNDMVGVDRTLEGVRAMERYIDAQAGGPGLGWLRVVETPADAREAINQGKLAMVLGIEISNIFNCFVTPPPGMPECTEETVRESVQKYYDAGVRVIFPVHKFDNGFSGGDGHRGFIELGNIVNNGHYSNYTLDCPDVHPSFDSGDVVFGGLNRPRDDYFSEPDFDMTGLTEDPLMTLMPLVSALTEGSLEGEYCQNQGLTNLGEVLFTELMARGVIIDIAHLPKKSVARALDILEENNYPALSTHGAKFDGRLHALGGTTGGGFGTCGDPDQPGRVGQRYIDVNRELMDATGLPGIPFAFDLNGLAGGRAPRFGDDSPCSQPQTNPVEYPFDSFDGGVEFTEPHLGEHLVDFNTEGKRHIGLLPELIEDARRDGISDEDLEPLFHSAETFIRVWESTEAARIP